jgi:hypothetical protein
MPSGIYANSPAQLMSNPPAPTPFSPAFSEVAAVSSLPNLSANQLATLPPQPSLGQLPGMGYVQNATGKLLFLIFEQLSFTHTLTFCSIYAHFNACANSVDPDQLAHLCHLILICNGHILVRNNLMNLKVNSVDPDQTAQMLCSCGISLLQLIIDILCVFQ